MGSRLRGNDSNTVVVPANAGTHIPEACGYGFPLARERQQHSCRPRECGDPYSSGRRLWVPACAGTTATQANPAKAGTHIPEAGDHGFPLTRERQQHSCRPRECGDPYSRGRWLWVPAYAGTTATQLSSPRKRGPIFQRPVVMGSRLRGNDSNTVVVPARGTPRRSRRGDPVAGTHIPEAGGYGFPLTRERQQVTPRPRTCRSRRSRAA